MTRMLLGRGVKREIKYKLGLVWPVKKGVSLKKKKNIKG